MTGLILHHFDISPFAEKARLIIGLKGLDWHSVQIPLVMPKPDLTALTGGYRKTPVLQCGAEIYCDTQRIALELERRFPRPSLFPGANAGMARALGYWSDRNFFEPGAGLSMGVNEEIPEPVLQDRKAFFNFMDFDTLTDNIPHLYSQLLAHVALVEEQLGDGRDYLFGAEPGLADINAYFVVWMVRNNVPPVGEYLAPYTGVAAWEQRMAAIGHGQRSEMEAEQALQIARETAVADGKGVADGDPLDFKAGDDVIVEPDDYGKAPVEGKLITLDAREISIRRVDDRAGEVNVHFPRAGYRVRW
ncbi:MAG: glutathione S-transferase family protein [Gammaproteobacteria bacterium]